MANSSPHQEVEMTETLSQGMFANAIEELDVIRVVVFGGTGLQGSSVVKGTFQDFRRDPRMSTHDSSFIVKSEISYHGPDARSQ